MIDEGFFLFSDGKSFINKTNDMILERAMIDADIILKQSDESIKDFLAKIEVLENENNM